MKNKIIITSAIILLSVIVLSVGFYSFHVWINKDITDNSYVCVEEEKDGFVLKPYEIHDEELDMKFDSFTVHDKENGTELFSCPDRFRSYDLHSIKFDENSYDIIVSSGDVGEVVYRYTDGEWKLG